MLLASSGSQLHLLLPFLKTCLPGGREIKVATGTGNSFFVVFGCLVCLSDGVAAGITLIKTAFFKPVVHRDARIKNEALALPP